MVEVFKVSTHDCFIIFRSNRISISISINNYKQNLPKLFLLFDKLANPPFVAIIMKNMAIKLIRLLSNERNSVNNSNCNSSSSSSNSNNSNNNNNNNNNSNERPLSFVVIVPGWLEDEGYNLMSTSKVKRAHWIVAKEEHGFCDGAQHQRRDRFRASPYDTAIFVLQNDAGSRKWPVMNMTRKKQNGKNEVCEESIEAELRRAFATGVPIASAVARRKRDGRGFADEDGGGGVYKGKKKRKTGEGVVQRRKIENQQNKWKRKKKKSLKK
jgi:hypothetical protein